MIPVSEPALDGNESRYVAECVETGWISSAGRFIEAFEDAWASYCGRAFGVAVSNGTAALELAVEALDLSPGDEVILPSFTIISCALAVVRVGATPVLVDADPETWCMDVDQVAEKITSRTRAIMPVHIYGHPVDMDPLLALARAHGLAIIEDAAEAHGAEYRGERGWRRAGSFGEASCFSFYANKVVTTGEGGMVVTDDERLARRLRSLRNLAFEPGRRFVHRELGHNFRLTNVQAAIGLAQVERVDELVARKRAIGRQMADGLASVPGLRTQVQRDWARGVYWMNGVVIDRSIGMDATAFAASLRERGIETRPFFLGMHRQPVLLERQLVGEGSFPITDEIADQGLYLPSGATLTDAQVDDVIAATRSAMS